MTEQSPDHQEITNCISKLKEIEDEVSKHALNITQLIEEQNKLISKIKEPNDRWICSTLFLNAIKPYEENLKLKDCFYLMRSQFYHVGMKYLKFLHPKACDIPHKLYAWDFDDSDNLFITDIPWEVYKQIHNYCCELECDYRITQRKYPSLNFYYYDEDFYFNERQDIIKKEWVWCMTFWHESGYEACKLSKILDESGYTRIE